MTDLETHPVGTAARIEQLEAQNKELGNFLAAYMAEAFTAGRTVNELTEAITRANAATAGLSDPIAVHANMLRGTIAKPSFSNIQHLYRAEFDEHANAATAAAYEVAARAIMKKCHDDMDRKEEAAIVRALATPDQTAALDKLIAEAEARVWAEAGQVARATATCILPSGHFLSERCGDAILAASKKGGV